MPDAAPPPPPPPPDPLRHQPELSPADRILVVIDGEERWVELNAALAAGYTVIDLSDEWTPFIFKPTQKPDGTPSKVDTEKSISGWQQNKTDPDGLPLPADERNYLEVFGITPNMSVLSGRFLGDERLACLKDIDFDAIAAGGVDSDAQQIAGEAESGKASSSSAQGEKSAQKGGA